MSSFRFQTVPNILVEAGAANRLGVILREHFPDLTRLCVITDAFLHKSGLLEQALANLAAHGWQVTVIDDVIADPPEHVVLSASQREPCRGADYSRIRWRLVDGRC